jgi:hypothetical protein
MRKFFFEKFKKSLFSADCCGCCCGSPRYHNSWCSCCTRDFPSSLVPVQHEKSRPASVGTTISVVPVVPAARLTGLSDERNIADDLHTNRNGQTRMHNQMRYIDEQGKEDARLTHRDEQTRMNSQMRNMDELGRGDARLTHRDDQTRMHNQMRNRDEQGREDERLTYRDEQQRFIDVLASGAAHPTYKDDLTRSRNQRDGQRRDIMHVNNRDDYADQNRQIRRDWIDNTDEQFQRQRQGHVSLFCRDELSYGDASIWTDERNHDEDWSNTYLDDGRRRNGADRTTFWDDS